MAMRMTCNSPRRRSWWQGRSPPPAIVCPCRRRFGLPKSPRSARLDQLLQAAQPVGSRLIRIDLRPRRPRDLADIDVAARIDGDAVRCDELAGIGAGMEIAEPGEDLALVADDADARAEIGHVAIHRLVGAELADIAERLLAARHVEAARP